VPVMAHGKVYKDMAYLDLYNLCRTYDSADQAAGGIAGESSVNTVATLGYSFRQDRRLYNGALLLAGCWSFRTPTFREH